MRFPTPQTLLYVNFLSDDFIIMRFPTPMNAFILPYSEEPKFDFCARDYHVVRAAVNFITKNYSS